MLIMFVIGVILLVVALLAAKFCYRIAFFSLNNKEQDIYTVPPGEQYEKVADKMLELIGTLDQLPYEQLYITARDGVQLAARYYHFKDGAPIQIQFHGYRGNGVREYACGNQLAANIGYNSVVVDERAHGKSGGHTITFGIKERWDCADWTKYVAEKFGEKVPIILSGVSMGAATVLMASELDLPKNVAVITADCPYSSPGAIIRKVCSDIKLPPWLAYPFVTIGALLYGHFKLWESSAVSAVRNTRIPILLIHGDDDRLVPCSMSKEIYAAAAGDKRLAIFPGAGHGLSYFTDTKRYEETMKSFLRSCGLKI